MKKLIKWIMRIAVIFVLLVVVAAFVLPMVIDPNDYKQTIEEKIYTNIGRKAHLNGEIEWQVFPWLALTFNEVTVDNEKGFKGKTLADIQSLSARIKLLPLLSKNIEIGKVTLEDAQFDLQVSKRGNSNWQSILTHLESDADSSSPSGDKASPGSVNIEGINLSNINLNYTDLQSNTKATIHRFNLSTGEITKTQPVNLDMSLQLTMPDSGLDVAISSKIIANNLLADTGAIAEITVFSIDGKLSTQSTLPITIALERKGLIDLEKDTLAFPAITVSLGDANILTSLSGANISKSAMKLSGSYKLDAFDMNAFLKQLTGAYFVTNNSLDDFSSSGVWSMSGKRLVLDKLKINYAETTIDGSANINNTDKMSGSFKLHMNKFNVDDFLGDEETASNSKSDIDSTSSQSPDIDFGHLKGTLGIDSLSVSGTTVNNLNITVNTNGSKMVLSPIKADFYKGLLISAIKVDTKATRNKVIIEHNMNKIHAGPLLTDLAGSKLLTGIGDFDVNLSIDKPFSDIPLKTAHGNINYTLKDGAIYGVDVFGMMQKGLSMIYPEVNEQSSDEEKKTSFALMQINADINQGVLTTNTLKIESPYLRIGGKLTIDLINMTIDGTIEPMLLDIPEQLVSDKYRKLLNIPIPVRLSGSLLEPKISIDAKKLILATQKQRIDKETDKLKRKLLDSLFGKDKK